MSSRSRTKKTSKPRQPHQPAQPAQPLSKAPLKKQKIKSAKKIVNAEVAETSAKLAVAPLSGRVQVGFISRNQKLGNKTRQRFFARVDFLVLQQVAKADPGSIDIKEIRASARAQAIADFFAMGSHPFGYQKYVTFAFNTHSGEVRMAGAFFTAQYPGQRILFSDLQSQAQNRFNDHRAICFNIGSGERSKEELEKIVKNAIMAQGLSSDSALHKKFQRAQERERARAVALKSLLSGRSEKPKVK